MGAPVTASPALRIEAPAANTIDAALVAWLANMAARGKKPDSIRTYRCMVEAAAPALGWRTTHDISAESLSAWMEGKREAGEWRGCTFNHALSCFKGFSRYLTKTRWLTTDPLACLDRAEDDGGDGARAATTDEARKIIRYAWERQQLDRRARGNRALVWQCCFTMGLRAGEPEKLRWSHVLLDEEIPLVRWTKEINKNRKVQEVVIAPETVPLLRAHRETVPNAQTDLVFPIVPPRHTFNHDRDLAQIPAKDTRGRTLSSHSARKWTATTLTTENVNPRVIDRLLRHSGGVQQRYADISAADQLQALKALPNIWPTNCEDWLTKRLTQRAVIADTEAVTLATLHNSASPPRLVAHSASVTTLCARRAGDAESGVAPNGDQHFQHDNGQNRTVKNGAHSGSEVADLLRAVANFIDRAESRKDSADGNRTG